MASRIHWVILPVDAEYGLEGGLAAGREEVLDSLKVARVHKASKDLCHRPHLIAQEHTEIRHARQRSDVKTQSHGHAPAAPKRGGGGGGGGGERERETERETEGQRDRGRERQRETERQMGRRETDIGGGEREGTETETESEGGRERQRETERGRQNRCQYYE